jgi:hypothetical protein
VADDTTGDGDVVNAEGRSKTVAQVTWLPTRKMVASGTAGLVAFAIVTVGAVAGWPVPEEVAFAAAGVVMWAAGYVTRERRPPANGLAAQQLERLAVRGDCVEPRLPGGESTGGVGGGMP